MEHRSNICAGFDISASSTGKLPRVFSSSPTFVVVAEQMSLQDCVCLRPMGLPVSTHAPGRLMLCPITVLAVVRVLLTVVVQTEAGLDGPRAVRDY